MKLRFHAVGLTHADARLVPERHVDGSHFAQPVGAVVRYVGRQALPVHIPPFSDEPYECESDTFEADYLLKCCREGDLIPADEATAAAAGIPIAFEKFRKGEHPDDRHNDDAASASAKGGE